MRSVLSTDSGALVVIRRAGVLSEITGILPAERSFARSTKVYRVGRPVGVKIGAWLDQLNIDFGV